MIALDSNVWIERWSTPGAGATIVREVLARGGDPNRIVVPAIVVFETERWLLRNVDDDAAIDELSAMLATHDLVPVDDTLARHAALVSVSTRLAAADATILAATRSRNATLLTYDADFAGIPDVVVLER